MTKRTVFTTITPLPANITREVVIDFLHNHLEMIDLNPLVKERHPIKPPAHASPEETACVWWSLTDKVSYLPGGLVASDVSYTCAFHDLPNGLQTHCYAPMGLDIRDKWTLNGSLPGEPIEAVELGIGAPLQGLYIREDVDMRCNIMMTSFVKRTLKKAHAALVERLKVKAQIATAANLNHTMSIRHSVHNASLSGSPCGPTSTQQSWRPDTPEQLAARPMSTASGSSIPPPQTSPRMSEFTTGSTIQQQNGPHSSPPNSPPQYSSPLQPSVTWQSLKPTTNVSSAYHPIMHGKTPSQSSVHHPPHPDYGYLPYGPAVDQYGRPYQPYPGYGYAPAPLNPGPPQGPIEMDARYAPMPPPKDSKSQSTTPGNQGTNPRPNPNQNGPFVAELEG